MSKHLYIRPAPAPTEDDPDARRHVRDPMDARAVPHEGKEVLWNVYWDRRLVDGDVEICEPPAPAPPEEDGPEETPPKSGRAKTQAKD